MTNNTPDYNDNLYFEKAKEMTDLTEQWKKGELLPRYYYIKDNKNKIEIDEYVQWYKERGQKSGKSFIYYKVMEVLAPVPTFDEWKASYNCMLENEVLRLKNAQLKELLKECKTPLKVYNEMFGYKEELLTKIDEVLK